MDGDRVVPDVDWATMFFSRENGTRGFGVVGLRLRMVAAKRNDDDVDVDIEVVTQDKGPGAKIRPYTSQSRKCRAKSSKYPVFSSLPRPTRSIQTG